MPMPASVNVIVFAVSSVEMVTFSAASGSMISCPLVFKKRSFSEASAAFEISSRTKISLSV